MDFTRGKYVQLLLQLKESGYEFITYADYCSGNLPQRFVMLRHDVDSKPENSIMVGDSRLDILCSRNAGVKSVLVGWSATLAGKTKEDFPQGEAPDFIIDKPSDLLDII